MLHLKNYHKGKLFFTDLFHQYIAQSGSAMSDWGLDSDPIHSAIEIGKEAGCLDSEINALTECLMAADPMELTKAHTRFQVCICYSFLSKMTNEYLERLKI